MSGEKKRLEQDLLQRRASNVFMVDPRFSRFQEEANPIDRIRLIQSQQLAGQVPVSDSLKTQIKKTKRKAKRKKNLRGDLSKNLTAQRRFTRGERREKDTEEPRILGDPERAGFGVDPAIERRRLDLEEARERQRQLERVTDRRLERERYGDDLAFRRLELQARQADRAVLAGIPAAVAAALPAPAPIVIPPAAAPAINIAPAPINIAPAQVRVEAPQVRVEAPQVRVDPTINVPPPVLPARADADPIPEIQRLGAELRADVNAFGAEQDDRNRDLFRQLREATELENRQVRESVDAIEARQQAQDENRRADLARQDAQNQEVQVQIGLGEVAMGQARDVVIQEIRDAEGRLRGAQRELDTPTGFDDVILAADRPALRRPPESPVRVPIEEVDSPTPEAREPEADPEEPGGIGGVIAGGGELNLPNVVIEQPGRIGPDESLRLSPDQSRYPPPAGFPSGGGGGGRPQVRRSQRAAAEVLGDVIGGAEERLGLEESPRFGEEGSPDTPLVIREPTPPSRQEEVGEFLAGIQGTSSEEGSQQSLQFELDEDREDRLELDPVNPVNVADALRLSRLALDEAEPGLLEEEADEAEQQRLRLVDTQDFMAGFERPASPRLSPVPVEGGSPLVGGGTPAGRLEELLAQPSPTESESFSPRRGGSPRGPVAESFFRGQDPEEQAEGFSPEQPSTQEEEALLREAYGGEQEEEEEEVGSAPRAGQVAQGIAQFGGAVQPAPDRVIEDAGIQVQPELRPLVPLEDIDVGDEVQYIDKEGQRVQGVVRNIDRVQEGQEDIEQGAAVGVELPGGDVRDTVLDRLEPVEEEVGQVQDTRPQAIRDSYNLYQETIPEMAGNVRQGPQGARGQRGGVGYRFRNNTDKKLKKIQPGDVVNVTGVDAGADGRGRYRLDTEGTATGTRVGLDQLDPLLQSGDLLFERGHRHELGGHFDEQPYGPPPVGPVVAEENKGPGFLQQGAEAVGGAAAGVVGGAARLAGGAALGVGQGLYDQLPAAGDVGAALGRGAVAGVAGAGRLAAGAVGAVVGGGEEEEQDIDLDEI